MKNSKNNQSKISKEARILAFVLAILMVAGAAALILSILASTL